MAFHIDIETRCALDLTKVGAHRYAEEAEIIVLAIAKDDGPVCVYSPFFASITRGQLFSPLQGQTGDEAKRLLAEASQPGQEVWAHNAEFESAHLPQIPLGNWRCTAALCRHAGVPASLGKASDFLGLRNAKDTKGQALIRKFCISPFADPAEHPDDFFALVRYCVQDVEVERELAKELASFNYSPYQLKTWQLTQRINTRGLAVDVATANKAKEVIELERGKAEARYRELTGLAPKQNTSLPIWLKGQGVKAANAQKATLDKLLAKPLPANVREALTLRCAITSAALDKVPALLRTACQDGRVRGTLVYHGAGPGRWSGQHIQPQNFRRPERGSEEAMRLLRDCGPDAFETRYDAPLDMIASGVRHLVRDDLGYFDFDFSGIEARLINWLADQHDALARVRAGVDSYRVMAATIFGGKPDDYAKDSFERFVGKQAVLGCGYGMGAATFERQTILQAEAQGIDPDRITPQLAQEAVTAFRRMHSRVVALWRGLDDAARKAVEGVETVARYNGIAFCLMRQPGHTWLRCRLPSGRVISYYDPRVEEGNYGPQIVYTGKQTGKSLFGDVYLYGGKITENVVQGIAADLMSEAAQRIELAGYEVATLIHDEALIYVRPDKPLDAQASELHNLTTTLPDWATGLPLDAEGGWVDSYTK